MRYWLLLSLYTLTHILCTQAQSITMRGVTFDQPPFVFQNIDESSGVDSPYGLYPELLPMVFQEAGYDLNLIYTPSPDGSSGSQQPDGTWTGGVNEMLNDRADIFIGSLSISESRIEAGIQNSFAFHENTLAILIQEPVKEADPWSFLGPFKWDLWITLIFTGLFVAIVAFIFEFVSPYASRYHPDPVEREKGFFRDIILQSYWMMVLGGNPSRPNSVRIVYWFFAFFSVIIIASYTANLATFLILDNAPPVVQSLEDLRSKGLPFGVVKNSNAESFFDQPAYEAMKVNLRRVESFDDGVAQVRDGTISGFVSTLSQLNYFANQPPCDIIVVGSTDRVGVVMIGIGFSPFVDPEVVQRISRAVLSLQESGVIEALWKKIIAEYQVSCASDSGLGLQALGLVELQGLFYFLLIGIGIGIGVLILENIFFHCIAHPFLQSSTTTVTSGSWKEKLILVLHGFFGGLEAEATKQRTGSKAGNLQSSAP